MAKASSRNYVKERKNEPPKRKEDRKKRGRARYAAIKAGKVRVGDGKVVDHKKPLKKGGSNKKSNLQVTSAKASHKQGGKAGNAKAKGRRSNPGKKK